MTTILFADVAVSTLAGSITPSDTTAVLAAGTGVFFPQPSGDERFTMTFRDAATGQTREIVYVTNVTVDTITIVRGQQGTVALNWNAGDIAGNFLTAGDMGAFAQQGQIQDESGFYALDIGSGNNIVIVPPISTTLTAIIGAPIRIRKSSSTNTGSVLLQVVGNSAVPLVYPSGAPMGSNDLPAEGILSVVYDGSEFQLQSIPGSLGLIINNQISATPVGAFVNKFYNGSAAIAQRGLPIIVAAGTKVYTLDGFLVGAAGNSVSVGQGGAIDGSYAIKTIDLVGQAGVTDASITKPIESNDAFSLAGRSVIFQALVRNNTLGPLTPALTILTANGVDDWSASTAVVSNQPLQTIGVGSTSVVSYAFTMSDAAANGVSVRLDFGAALGAAATSILATDWDIRTTPSLTAAPPVPEIRTYSMEFLQCQRYLPGLFPKASGNAGAGGTVESSTVAGVSIPFYTQSRLPVTGLTLSNVSDWEINVAGSPTAIATFTYNGSTSTGALLQVTGSGFGSAGDSTNLIAVNSNASLVLTGAELDGAAI